MFSGAGALSCYAVMAGLLLHTLPQALKLSVSLNGLLGEGVVEPPVDQRRHGGEAGGDELLQSAALDGQHGLAQSAQDLVDEGRRWWQRRQCGEW